LDRTELHLRRRGHVDGGDGAGALPEGRCHSFIDPAGRPAAANTVSERWSRRERCQGGRGPDSSDRRAGAGRLSERTGARRARGPKIDDAAGSAPKQPERALQARVRWDGGVRLREGRQIAAKDPRRFSKPWSGGLPPPCRVAVASTEEEGAATEAFEARRRPHAALVRFGECCRERSAPASRPPAASIEAHGASPCADASAAARGLDRHEARVAMRVRYSRPRPRLGLWFFSSGPGGRLAGAGSWFAQPF
jgi:hypothetical protein